MFYKLYLILTSVLMMFSIPVHGYVTEQTYEGYAYSNDYYIVNLNGELYEVEADDLIEGDEVTVYFFAGEPIRTLYGHR